MTGLTTLIGQQRPIRMLCNALINDSIPHALLFTGEDGVGKATAAIEIAKVCNCAGISGSRKPQKDTAPEQHFAACGICRYCRRIEHGTHPDFHVIKPAGAYIRIDQIRELCGRLALKPDEASNRFVLIADAHTMNPEAGNALLKILEEPPEATFFVLTAPDTQDLLPTIVSRCRHVRFNPIPQKELAEYLGWRSELDNENAATIASLARGSLSRALDMASEDWMTRRNFIIQRLCRLPQQPPAFRLAFAEMLAAERAKLEVIFEIMKNWYRDLAVFAHFPGHIYNQDLREQIRSACKQESLETILEKSDAIDRAQKALSGNANVRLALDVLVMELAE
ncbi:MAG: DNA polymerase III subunit delta' [Desulfobacterales bacterium]|nr:DNA polymerase III subunit delta' [Desulfobacterales bacterium]